jgi:hypothetical protein
VLSPIQTYSSTLSVGETYAKIRIAAVHFCNGERPLLPTASTLPKYSEIFILNSKGFYNSEEHMSLHSEPSSKLSLCILDF